MDQTGTYVSRETAKLSTILRQMRLFDDGGEFEKYCLGYLQKKVSNKPLRAYFARKMYEYLTEDQNRIQFQVYQDNEILFLRKLPFVFEIVITIQYLDNQILDEKYDLKSQNHPKIVQNLISSNVLREVLFLYIDQEITPHFSDRRGVESLIQNLRRLLLWVDIGQYLDKEYNHYKRWKAKIPNLVGCTPFFDDIVHRAIDETMNQVKFDVPDKSEFIEAYFRRIYLSNVYFFRCITEILLTMGNCNRPQQEHLLLFSTQYGFMLQIINDYSDFAYSEDKKIQKQLKTSGKKSTDFFADLYNFNVTLPLIYHLNKGARRKIEAYLEGGIKKKNILTHYPKQVMQEIDQSGAILNSILRSMELAESAKQCLDTNNPHSAFFANMCDMAIDNKFHQVFKK